MLLYHTILKTEKVAIVMTDESKLPAVRSVKPVFVGAENLPTHYVNVINVQSGSEEFFLTLGTAVPVDIINSSDLENIDSINAHPLFRCAISRPVMKQLIDLMTNLYENQTEQIEHSRASQGKDEEYGDSSRPS